MKNPARTYTEIQKSPSILAALQWSLNTDKQPGTSVIDLFLVDASKSPQTDTSKPIVMMIKQLSSRKLIWITLPLCNPDNANEEAFTFFPWFELASRSKH